MDAIISQYDRLYLDQLIRYERVLSQRNSLLKQLSAGRWDETTLSVLDEQLSDLAGPISKPVVVLSPTWSPSFSRSASPTSPAAKSSLEYDTVHAFPRRP